MGTTGKLLHKFIPSTQLVYPHMASTTRNGHVVVHYADRSGCLAVFTCNGKQLCQHLLRDPALESMLIIVGMIIILLTSTYIPSIRYNSIAVLTTHFWLQ